MTALEINLVSPAGPHKLGGGLNLANRPSGPQCASLLFKCNHWKRKLKADLSWMSYNSLIQTRTHTYLKGAFISTKATKLVCFGDFIMNSWAQGHWAVGHPLSPCADMLMMMSKYTHWFDFARYTKCSIFSRGGGKENICSHITKGVADIGLEGGCWRIFTNGASQLSAESAAGRLAVLHSAVHNDAQCNSRTTPQTA